MRFLRGIRDLPLWGLIGSFVVWEVFAHFVARNRGSHTLSNRIWSWETKGGLAARLAVAAAIIVLFTHLVLHIP